MNYIKHLSAFYMKASIDDRLTSAHISLYHALFQFWNMNRFVNPISVNRAQLLKYSKIGSNHTFYRTLSELHDWAYIEYHPSYAPAKGSYVNLCNFDIAQIEKEENLGAESTQLRCNFDIADGAKSAQLWCKNDIAIGANMHPSINNINNKTFKPFLNRKNKSKKQKNERNLETDFKPSNTDLYTEQLKKKRKKVAPQKENAFKAPSLEEVTDFFQNEKYPEIESRKFFYYFEAKGWRIGENTIMTNWKAAAHHWMLKSASYINEQKSNPLKLNTNKDYGEPL